MVYFVVYACLLLKAAAGIRFYNDQTERIDNEQTR